LRESPFFVKPKIAKGLTFLRQGLAPA